MTKLNPNQQKAVVTTEGHVLILAGAGSGKTRVLVHRIGHLIREKGVPPTAILGMTFMNKAAEEMRERVAGLIGKEKAKQVTLSTFHSFCMKILRKDIERLGFTSRFSLYDERDMKRLVTLVAEDLFGEQDLDPIVQSIMTAKGKGKRPEGKMGEVYDKVHIAMRAHNAVDFDSLLSLTVELFKQFPDVLEAYQDHFRYIMIDEYQDTNPIQYELASMLAEKYKNLCVVGDDDQSIYAWRGAEIQHILEFPADSTIKLEQNYRSTSHILQAANAVIRNNLVRHDKTLKAAKESGDTIEIFNAPTDQDEVDAVIDRILYLKEHKNLRWKDMAVLYRSNQLSRLFELKLMNTSWRKEGHFVRGIPYQVFGGMDFFERSEVKDLMSYLRIFANERDQEALLRIVNYPRRGISNQTLDKLTTYNRQNDIPLLQLMRGIAKLNPDLLNFMEELTPQGIKGIHAFVTLYEKAQERFATSSLSEALQWLVETIDYKKTIFDEVKSEKAREFKWENVQECIRALNHYENQEPSPSLEDFVSGAMLDNRKDKRKERLADDKLNLMTFHSAKGLEFPAVFLIGIEDNLIPHVKSQTEQGIEEERRLLYVALTRAMQYLSLSMARKRVRHGKLEATNPSRFLFEIPKEILRVTSWKSVQ
ncbi:ATP-dependent helicase [Simkania sp.]|uniref:ATP-dependent helicase n=1 Tax=Simkania sp. TaxID=34094 RepID=UPI003B52BA6C